MTRVPELYCSSCQAEYYTTQVDMRPPMWRCPSCLEWNTTDDDIEVFGIVIESPSKQLTLTQEAINTLIDSLRAYTRFDKDGHTGEEIETLLELLRNV